MKILIIIGSPKKHSFNYLFSQYAYQYLKKYCEVSYLDYHDLPYISSDNQYDFIETVERIKKEIEQADGLWIFASEYNLSYCAQLKNLLDWLSVPIQDHDFDQGTFIKGKKVTITSVAGTTGGRFVLTKLYELLNFIGMDLMKDDSTSVALLKEDFKEDIPHFTVEDFNHLYRQCDSFICYIKGSL